MKVGIIGCGAIANIITTSIVSEDIQITILSFWDHTTYAAITTTQYQSC